MIELLSTVQPALLDLLVAQADPAVDVDTGPGLLGGAIAYLAIADRLMGRADGWMKPLLVAAGISGGLALTGIGGLLSLCIGAAGFGAILRDLLG